MLLMSNQVTRIINYPIQLHLFGHFIRIMVGFPPSGSLSMTPLDMDPIDRGTPGHQKVGFENITNAAYLQVFSVLLYSIGYENPKYKFKKMLSVVWC
jgi:hypothetical protein